MTEKEFFVQHLFYSIVELNNFFTVMSPFAVDTSSKAQLNTF